MKKRNLLRIGWIVGIYVILLLILYLVVVYKVKWEDKDLNTYLYFYNCSGDLCTTTTKPNYYFGSVVCKNNNCPYITEKYDSYLILRNKDKDILYNYKRDKIISDSYITYKLSSDHHYIVMDKNKKYSVIDEAETIILEGEDKVIEDYNSGYVLYKEDGKYGIYNDEKNIDIKPLYSEIKLINDDLYAYLESDKYYIASYDTEIAITDKNYDYIEPINDNTILVFSNNQLDILDKKLLSKLVLKINCKYTYTKEKERASLNIKKDQKFVYFNIYNENNEYINYIYDIKENKLHN